VDVLITQTSHLIVRIDGRIVMNNVIVVLPNKVRVAFTAGVGGIGDTHAVINPTVTYASAG
jgi:hypothetical protein